MSCDFLKNLGGRRLGEARREWLGETGRNSEGVARGNWEGLGGRGLVIF